jgi:hypothetical protein
MFLCYSLSPCLRNIWPRERKQINVSEYVGGKSDSASIKEELPPQKSTVTQLDKTVTQLVKTVTQLVKAVHDFYKLWRFRVVFTKANFIQNHFNLHRQKLLSQDLFLILSGHSSELFQLLHSVLSTNMLYILLTFSIRIIYLINLSVLDLIIALIKCSKC